MTAWIFYDDPRAVGFCVFLAILILVIRSRRARVSYEFTLPNDSVRLDEVLVRARGRKVPKAIGGSRV